MSRPKRWAKAVADAQAGVEALRELRDEYQDWLDGLPEGLEDGPTAEKLDVVVDLDLDSLDDILGECEGADLPLGFGRD